MAKSAFDTKIDELDDWRGVMLRRIRAVINAADPDVVEELKWRDVPVWSDAGILCTGETYKAIVKMTFAKGASLPDPEKLFNSSLEGNTRRAIDLHEHDQLDEAALTELIREAVALNRSKPSKAAATKATSKKATPKKAAPKAAPKKAPPKKAAPKKTASKPKKR